MLTQSTAMLALLLASVCLSAAFGSTENSCPLMKDHKVEFLTLVVEVQTSLLEKHLGDNMLPICSQLTKKPTFEKEPQTWQRVEQKNLLVFSAFVERRKEADGPGVRVIGSGLQKRFNHVGNHYCQMWYHGLKHPVSVGPAIYNVIYPSLMHGDMWVSHFILCKLPEDFLELPYAVSITATRCERATNELMVLNRDLPNVSDSHALCLPPMYNYYKGWELLVEQIELHKLLGTSQTVVYSMDIAHETTSVLRSYTGDIKENVTLVQFKFPGGLKTSYRCQRAALNDCLYRMGHKYKYVTITDMDEVLVPRKERTWTALIKRLHAQAPDTGAFIFQHAYFRRNISTEAPTLVTQSSFWRTDVVTPAGKIRSKVMYEAVKAVSIDFHSPYFLVPSARELILEPSDGMLHHYRSKPMERFYKHPEDYNYIEDRYMEIYKAQLRQAVARRTANFDFASS